MNRKSLSGSPFTHRLRFHWSHATLKAYLF